MNMIVTRTLPSMMKHLKTSIWTSSLKETITMQMALLGTQSTTTIFQIPRRYSHSTRRLIPTQADLLVISRRFSIHIHNVHGTRRTHHSRMPTPFMISPHQLTNAAQRLAACSTEEREGIRLKGACRSLLSVGLGITSLLRKWKILHRIMVYIYIPAKATYPPISSIHPSMLIHMPS